MPIVFPHVEPWVAKYMLWFAVFLLVGAVALWLLGLRRLATDGAISQASLGAQSPNIGLTGGNVTINYGPPAGPLAAPYRYSLDHVDALAGAILGAKPEALVPDFFLGQLVARLLIHQGKVPDDAKEAEAYFLRMELEIADKVYQRNIAVWGRKGTEPAARLSKHDLHLVRIDARQCRLLLQREEGKPLFVYHHVTFNRGQVDEAWPEVTQND